MTSENDFIRRYRGAFSPDDCKKLIEYIETFDKIKLGFHRLHFQGF